METLKAAFVLAGKDLVSWFRTPVHVLVTFAPILIIMILFIFAFGGVGTMPVVVLLDAPDDPVSVQFMDTIKSVRAEHYPWFKIETTDRERGEALFRDQKVLALIEIPGIGDSLRRGEKAAVKLHINNLNDDITKNFRQRIQEACLVFNQTVQSDLSLNVCPPVLVEFNTFLPKDLSALVFFGAGLIAMAIVMGGINNACTLVAREFEEKTYKELVLSPGILSIIIGKWTSALVQTFITVGLVWGLAMWLCHFIPQDNLLPLLFLIFIGSLAFAGLGTLLGLCFKQVIPAAITGMLISIIGWWFGGIIWVDVWPKTIQGIVAVLPTTYLIRPFTRAALLSVYSTYWFDVMILVVFGIITGYLAYRLLQKRIAL
jgi:ABC-2 type transport system permease protein